jgi:hypothetical protein
MDFRLLGVVDLLVKVKDLGTFGLYPRLVDVLAARQTMVESDMAGGAELVLS